MLQAPTIRTALNSQYAHKEASFFNMWEFIFVSVPSKSLHINLIDDHKSKDECSCFISFLFGEFEVKQHVSSEENKLDLTIDMHLIPSKPIL